MAVVTNFCPGHENISGGKHAHKNKIQINKYICSLILSDLVMTPWKQRMTKRAKHNKESWDCNTLNQFIKKIIIQFYSKLMGRPKWREKKKKREDTRGHNIIWGLVKETFLVCCQDLNINLYAKDWLKDERLCYI